MNASSSIRIWFENLAAEDSDDRLPLSKLSPDMHLHGGLRIEIGGRLVPFMGYFGADDVCFGQWLSVLLGVRTAFAAGDTRYVFDEGEQGQPAFVFERIADGGYLSLADSRISGGKAVVDWQRVPFDAVDLISAIDGFHSAFVAELRRECPVHAESWLKEIVEQPSDV